MYAPPRMNRKCQLVHDHNMLYFNPDIMTEVRVQICIDCAARHLGEVFFCFSQIRQPHTRDQRPKKKALVLSLRAGYTKLRDKKKTY